MTLRWLSLTLTTLAATGTLYAYAGVYRDARINGDVLTISSKHGEIKAQKTEQEQARFTDVRISEDGNTVGWVTLVNCCASYPSGVSLVLFRGGKVVQNFFDFGTIKNWAFSGNDAVTVSRQFPHGPEYLGFFNRRITDGVLLGKYECGYSHDSGERISASPVPGWAHPFAGDCP